VSLSIVPDSDPLAGYAIELRAIVERTATALNDLAAKLHQMFHDHRVGMTQTALAAWCEEEGLGIGSQRRISQLIAWHDTRLMLEARGASTAVLALPERVMRPVTEALHPKSPKAEALPVRMAARILTGLVEGYEGIPTSDEVVEKLAETAWGKRRVLTEVVDRQPEALTPADALTLCANQIDMIEGRFLSAAKLPWDALTDRDRRRLITRLNKAQDAFRAAIGVQQ